MSLVCVYNTDLHFLAHILLLLGPKHVMERASNVVMRDSTLYVAQNVGHFITALMVSDIDLTPCQD